MNRNIYLVGVARSGKSTLAKLIKKEFPLMNIISFEAVRNGFIKSQPELNMENRNSSARKEILPVFLFEFATWNLEMSGYGAIIEGSFADVETIVKNKKQNDIVICLGFNGRKQEEIVDSIIKYSQEKDYTNNWSKEKIAKHFYDSNEKDTENIKACQKYNIPYYDTYCNRDKILLKILDDIKAMPL